MTAEELRALESTNEFRLTEAETASVLKMFEEMAQKESAMASVNTDGVDVMVHVMPMNNVFRADCHKQNFTRESLLEGSPEHTEDSWQVPRLVK